jgi:hypothetical protein
VHVRALVERDLLPFQFRHAAQGRCLGHDDRLGVRRRRLVADVDQVRARGLGKDRRRFADRAEVDAAHVQAFEQRGAGRELGPFDRDVLFGQAFFQGAAALQEREGAVFLVADAHLARRARSLGLRQIGEGSGDGGGKQQAERTAALAAARAGIE